MSINRRIFLRNTAAAGAAGLAISPVSSEGVIVILPHHLSGEEKLERVGLARRDGQ